MKRAYPINMSLSETCHFHRGRKFFCTFFISFFSIQSHIQNLSSVWSVYYSFVLSSLYHVIGQQGMNGPREGQPLWPNKEWATIRWRDEVLPTPPCYPNRPKGGTRGPGNLSTTVEKVFSLQMTCTIGHPWSLHLESFKRYDLRS